MLAQVEQHRPESLGVDVFPAAVVNHHQPGLGLVDVEIEPLFDVDGQPTGWSASHFSTEQTLGACPACEGRAVVARCCPERLAAHPDLPFAAGALKGTRPGR